jgi:hypothetical protein|tara:strand:+ start:191 stop:343 length:153 start_codon:yes stop_codon:yes gene_type:complete
MYTLTAIHTKINAIAITLNLNTALSIVGKNLNSIYAIAQKPTICNIISIM